MGLQLLPTLLHTAPLVHNLLPVLMLLLQQNLSGHIRGALRQQCLDVGACRVMASAQRLGSQLVPLKEGDGRSSDIAAKAEDQYCTPKSPKSILKCTASPDLKHENGRRLAWQDFHGKELYTVLEFVTRCA